MPTIDTDSRPTDVRTCPLCDTPLDPEHPNQCPKCDWVLGYRRERARPVGTRRDALAILLSVVPGLGHLYKGHMSQGIFLMFGGAFAIFAAGLVATATAGFGLLLLPLYWLAVMLHVFWLEDRNAVEAR